MNLEQENKQGMFMISHPVQSKILRMILLITTLSALCTLREITVRSSYKRCLLFLDFKGLNGSKELKQEMIGYNDLISLIYYILCFTVFTIYWYNYNIDSLFLQLTGIYCNDKVVHFVFVHLKLFINENRPCYEALIKKGSTTYIHAHESFPSGHSVQAFAGASYLVYIINLSNLPLITKCIITIFGYIGAILVAASRYFDNKHHLHDVLIGSVLGVCLTFVTIYLMTKAPKWK